MFTVRVMVRVMYSEQGMSDLTTEIWPHTRAELRAGLRRILRSCVLGRQGPRVSEWAQGSMLDFIALKVVDGTQ